MQLDGAAGSIFGSFFDRNISLEGKIMRGMKVAKILEVLLEDKSATFLIMIARHLINELFVWMIICCSAS